MTSSVASEIIHDVLSNPTEKFHNYQILIDEKEEILAELQEFCNQANYHLSIAYYDNKDENLLKVRLIKIIDEKDDEDDSKNNTMRYVINNVLIIGLIIGGLSILGYYVFRN
jgi:hypothetical protein